MIEMRRDGSPANRIDEIVGTGVDLHLERMDANAWHMVLTYKRQRLDVCIEAPKGLRIREQDEE